ncbi:MAG: type II secretion system F family protein [Gemmatimonadetes bacterium]|nr:type II secretion system F family protein [Gemmatimonadota bacterium]
MPQTIWIPALLLFAAAAFGTLGMVLFWEVVRDWLEQRAVRRQLASLVTPAGRRSPDERKGTSGGSKLLRTGEDNLASDDSWGAAVRELPVVRGSLVLLEQADVKWSPLTLYLLMFGAATATGGVTLTISGSLLLSGIVAATGATLPYLYLRRRRKLIAEAFESGLPEALDLLTRAIQAGHPLTAGMRMVAEEGPARVSEEFRKTSEEHRFGLSFDDALLGMVDRVGHIDVRIFVTAVLIQRESGGNLAEILNNLSQTIRSRFTIRRQLRVYTAQGRLSGYTLAALPIVVGSLIYLIEPDYVMTLFNNTLGIVLVSAGLILQIIGYIWIRQIVNIEI